MHFPRAFALPQSGVHLQLLEALLGDVNFLPDLLRVLQVAVATELGLYVGHNRFALHRGVLGGVA
eukprot:scaffold48_cov395-Prasinococcus_capsulatus_cf.AAC.52